MVGCLVRSVCLKVVIETVVTIWLLWGKLENWSKMGELVASVHTLWSCEVGLQKSGHLKNAQDLYESIAKHTMWCQDPFWMARKWIHMWGNIATPLIRILGVQICTGNAHKISVTDYVGLRETFCHRPPLRLFGANISCPVTYDGWQGGAIKTLLPHCPIPMDPSELLSNVFAV